MANGPAARAWTSRSAVTIFWHWSVGKLGNHFLEDGLAVADSKILFAEDDHVAVLMIAVKHEEPKVHVRNATQYNSHHSLRPNGLTLRSIHEEVDLQD